MFARVLHIAINGLSQAMITNTQFGRVHSLAPTTGPVALQDFGIKKQARALAAAMIGPNPWSHPDGLVFDYDTKSLSIMKTYYWWNLEHQFV